MKFCALFTTHGGDLGFTGVAIFIGVIGASAGQVLYRRRSSL